VSAATNSIPPSPNRFWRFIRFPLIRIILGCFWVAGSVAIASGLVEWLALPLKPISAPFLALCACFGYYSFVRLIEKRPVTELLGAGSVSEYGIGIVIGVALIATTVGILYAFDFYHVTGVNGWSVVMPSLMSAVMAGIFEEILIRGIVFRITEESLGSWLALLFSAVLFGGLHLPNDNATFFSAVAIALEAGVMLAAAYMLTRRLWLAIGIHMAWNFTQSGVFGVATSGVHENGILQSTLTGPTLLSGGEFGAEGSIVAVVVCLTGGVVMLWLAHRKGNFISPYWRRESGKTGRRESERMRTRCA
jgi:membrane protease YdiL (CAAX protease family)